MTRMRPSICHRLKKKKGAGGPNYNAHSNSYENGFLKETIPLLCLPSMNLVSGLTNSRKVVHTATSRRFRVALGPENATFLGRIP